MTLTVAIAFAPAPLPTGKTFQDVQVIFTDAAGLAMTNAIDGVTTMSTSFDTSKSAAGTATVVANAMATDGTVLASTSGTITIPGTPATFPAPQSMTLTFA
jgi:hypothetical protein